MGQLNCSTLSKIILQHYAWKSKVLAVAAFSANEKHCSCDITLPNVNWEGNFTPEALHQLLCAKLQSSVPMSDYVSLSAAVIGAAGASGYTPFIAGDNVALIALNMVCSA